MNKLYGFGSNGNGQLGIGHLEDTNIPQRCIGIPATEKIKKVVGGGNHSVVLTTTGKVYITGSSQLGSQQQKIWEKQQQEQQNNNPQGSSLPWTMYQERWSHDSWQDVACGWSSTLLVNNKGQVFGIGSSKFGELGSTMKEDQLELKRIAPDILNNIQSIACGWRHCIALDLHGKVYGWGWGKHGQLGSSNTHNHDDQNKKKGIKPTYIQSPFEIQLPEKISQISCGHLHTLFLNHQQNKIYGCGSNKYGQLDTSLSSSSLSSSSPLMLTTIDTIIDCCSSSPSMNPFYHCLTNDQHQYQYRVNKIATGWHSSLVLLSNGELFMWGRNDHYQLQQGLKEIKNVVSGSEHTLAILMNGRLLSWGWNEHGNCTTNKDDVLIPEHIQMLDDDGDDYYHRNRNKTVLLGAGCATSFIGFNFDIE